MTLEKNRERPRIVLGVTSFRSLTLLDGFGDYLASIGWDVHLVSSSQESRGLVLSQNVTWHEVIMARNPSPWKDLKALISWVRLLLRLKPDVVSSGTPKAGLLGTAASWVARIPRRTYHLRGLRLETETGLKQMLLKAIEKLTCMAATDVLAISPSLQEEAVQLGLAPSSKITTLGRGSSNGVDLTIFNSAAKTSDKVDLVRKNLGLASDRPVVGFVGRITKDKGVFELAAASRLLHDRGVPHQLLVIGTPELEEHISPWTQAGLTGSLAPVLVDRVDNIEDYYPMMDILALPTYREGMGNVLLEAGASGLPTVSTRVTGARDASLHGRTGIQIAVRNHIELAGALEKLISSSELRRSMGEAGARFVRQHFDKTDVWRRLAAYYSKDGYTGSPM